MIRETRLWSERNDEVYRKPRIASQEEKLQRGIGNVFEKPRNAVRRAKLGINRPARTKAPSKELGWRVDGARFLSSLTGLVPGWATLPTVGNGGLLSSALTG